MLPSSRGGRVELILSLGVLALGVFATVIAFQLPEGGGYARIGPNFMPKVVSAGLIGLGIWLLAEVFTGGWRERVPDDPAERGEHPFNGAAFAWVTAGLLAQMALIQHAGFVIAATALYALVARGFGSPRWARDAAIGFALGVVVYLFFVRFLNVNLPSGWFGPLLGTAGL
jgi:putative tricarboxylic transport membrane protein